MENQLIVYKPKLKLKKIFLTVLLIILICILIFVLTAIFTASIFIRTKWNETDYVNLKASEVIIEHNLYS